MKTKNIIIAGLIMCLGISIGGAGVYAVGGAITPDYVTVNLNPASYPTNPDYSELSLNKIDMTNGNDTIDLRNGTNNITMGTGTDGIQTGSNTDTIDMGTGTDSIKLGTDSDPLVSGVGDVDTIQTGNGADLIDLGADGDTISTGTGIDFIDMSDDNDVFKMQAGDDRIHMGDGSDIISFANNTTHSTTGVEYLLFNQTVGGGTNPPTRGTWMKYSASTDDLEIRVSTGKLIIRLGD